jgi:hypothetical protein
VTITSDCHHFSLMVVGIVAAVAAAVGLGVRFVVNKMAGPEK